VEWQQGLWECGKVEPLFGETFPSGGGNPRFLRISTGAPFPLGHVSFYPQILLKNLNNNPLRLIGIAMKLLLLNRWYHPETYGGTETTLRGLAQSLIREGAEITVFCETRKMQTGWDAIDNARVYRHPGPPTIDWAWQLRSSVMYLNIIKWLRHLRPFLDGLPIIARTPWYAAAARHVFPETWITYWAPGSRPWFGLFQGKTEVTLKELIWNRVDVFQANVVRRFALRKSNLVVTESQHVREDLINRLKVNPAKIATRRDGIDLIEYNLRPKDKMLMEEFGIPNTGFVVLFVGRLEPMKNIDYLCHAFSGMRHKSAFLVLLGDGSERGHLEALCRDLEIQTRTVFAGWRSDVSRFYSLADVFVLPSRYEPYGMVFPEALASGLPGIGLRPSKDIFVATAEHISHGENGYMVDAGDTHDLSRRLDLLAEEPATRERMSHAARKIAAERYDWQHTAHLFLRDIPNFSLITSS
jgi:glycosyltransferase involved in cell wall biosynthesis